ncbi:MAG: tRNA (N6-isopentenyl adenosine(37)-C2)-methylthiotransferase MiaB [Legionellales bacterium]|jgi:tRNA-2-methylthio-N6-dimethylallyladenosine synthase|nr:tRNA (N6-isopentenyl adenosine(37)-C2)-methylthiotransferase MiaB [Legionellales bacterium]
MKLFLQTHGCQMNEYDSQKIIDIMKQKHGSSVTKEPSEADVLILNTCSIREKAEDKVYSEVGRWRKLKEKKPNQIIAVGGCVASQEGENIIKRAPYVDIVFGPQTLHRLPELITEHLKTGKSAIDISFPEIEKFDKLPQTEKSGPSAYVSIMEGCSKYCSYCIVPYTRGEEINRPFDDVINEIVNITNNGAREITLLGQNVNDYQGLMHDGSTADLALLIHYISSIDNVLRIRYSTSHPTAFRENLITAYAEEMKLANHLHLPIQSGSDRILTAMKRDYTTLEFKSKIRKLRAVRPNISISSDFIVGFPGETDADFEQTLKLVQDIGFDKSYSFIYSRRPGTPAANLADNVTLETKKQRLAKLQDALNKNTNKISDNMVGTVEPVLVTGSSKKSAQEISGRTENNRIVNFAGNSRLVGKIVQVKIVDVYTNSLRGEII